jgi:hypothetical protein
MIQRNVGGDFPVVELQKAYPTNYKTTIAQVETENEPGYLPVSKTGIDSIENYDKVFVGFPAWGMQTATGN